jgi:glycosyltransferase involved in cell wall biosynthesis
VKYLFVTNRYYPHVTGGAEVSVQTLAEELCRRGNSVVVVSLSVDNLPSIEEVNGVRVYRVMVNNLYRPFGGAQAPIRRLLWHLRDLYNISVAKEFGRILDLERPSHVSTHNLGGFSVAIWGQVKAREIVLIHTLHDYYLLCPKTTMFRRGRNCPGVCLSCRALSLPKRRLSRSVDVVVGISQFVLETHTRRGFFPNATQAVIYNSRKWIASPSSSPTYKQENPRPVRFGFFGRIEKQKGIESLLSALMILPQEQWSLKVAGRASNPEYLDQLRGRSVSYGVEFVGFSRPEEFFPTIDVLVVPSLWNEPLGVVAFEAWGFGVPVIVSRRGGLAEIVEPGVTGWQFEPEQQGSLEEIVHSVITDREILFSMREACLVRREFFVPERHADDFLKAVAAHQLDQARLANAVAASIEER